MKTDGIGGLMVVDGVIAGEWRGGTNAEAFVLCAGIG